ncbi:PilZ domain-containing protein [Croceicoccus mobilis]|uniref:PilZ domain-containing protein n=1 Tax=Croceicoccus mobilis TaxID=1703339 RepID=A0A916Z9Q8_9SPHN|nr:PilZ domain-containing protein [Croceicoccus mobilis]GGD83151.1 hypothetical protein GCM10010990_36520 [Croceicoccus mobilis]
MIVAKVFTEDNFGNSRSRPRRSVRVAVQALSNAGEPAVIRNLSQSGLLLETRASLKVGDTFEVDLPIAGDCSAEIVWSEVNRHGCRFLIPISSAAVSAAQLISPYDAEDTIFEEPGGAMEDFFDETVSRPSNKVWHAANFALFMLLLATVLFVVGMMKAAM